MQLGPRSRPAPHIVAETPHLLTIPVRRGRRWLWPIPSKGFVPTAHLENLKCFIFLGKMRPTAQSVVAVFFFFSAEGEAGSCEALAFGQGSRARIVRVDVSIQVTWSTGSLN